MDIMGISERFFYWIYCKMSWFNKLNTALNNRKVPYLEVLITILSYFKSLDEYQIKCKYWFKMVHVAATAGSRPMAGSSSRRRPRHPGTLGFCLFCSWSSSKSKTNYYRVCFSIRFSKHCLIQCRAACPARPAGLFCLTQASYSVFSPGSLWLQLCLWGGFRTPVQHPLHCSCQAHWVRGWSQAGSSRDSRARSRELGCLGLPAWPPGCSRLMWACSARWSSSHYPANSDC